jgi:hypothetical protein
VKGFESLLSIDLDVHRKPVARLTFQSQNSEQYTIQPLSGALENPSHMSCVLFV